MPSLCWEVLPDPLLSLFKVFHKNKPFYIRQFIIIIVLYRDHGVKWQETCR